MSGPGLRVIFMGTPDFSVPALRALIASSHTVIAVYTQPPRPKGRGQNVQKSPVHELAEKHGIPVFTPASLKKSPEAQAEFADLKPDVGVVAAYGLILPRALLDAPRYGCLNIHASLLPRWRGASPIQHAIWKGDRETGITIMQMEEGLDTGAMIVKEATPIAPTTTAQTLHDTLSEIGAGMIGRVLDTLTCEGRLTATPQNESDATYAPLLKKEDGVIDWTSSAAEIDCQIRALTPWPGTMTRLPSGPVLKVLAATVAEEISDAAPGTLINRTGEVACGGGTILHINTVQTENGKKMDMPALVNGGAIKPGDVFGKP